MSQAILKLTLEGAKACLPNQVKRTGIANGLDETVFAFINQVPQELLSDEMIVESFLRLWKYEKHLVDTEFELVPEVFTEVTGETPRNKTLRSQVISNHLRDNNNFNSDDTRLAALFIRSEYIYITLSKNLTSGLYSSILKRYGEAVKVHGSNVSWRFPIDKYGVVDFVIPMIQEDFVILGLETYRKEMDSHRDVIEPTPLTRVVQAHLIPKLVIVDINNDKFEILIGNESKKSANPFVFKLNENEGGSPFVVDFKYAKTIKSLISALGDKIFASADVQEFLPSLLSEGLSDFDVIKDGGVPSNLFCMMESRLSAARFVFHHNPRNEALTNAIRAKFPGSKFDSNKNYVNVSDTNKLSEVKRICHSLKIPTYFNLGQVNSNYENFEENSKMEKAFRDYLQGDNVFEYAKEYLDVVAAKSKASITHLGGRTFEIYFFNKPENKRLVHFSATSEEKTGDLIKFIGSNNPICDDETANALIGLGDLGCYHVETPNGLIYHIKPLYDLPDKDPCAINFNYMPPHCVRSENGKYIVKPTTATMALKLKEDLLKHGMICEDAKKDVIPVLTAQISEFQIRFDKSFTYSGTIQVDNFDGNEKLEDEQRGCVEYVLPVKKALIADVPGFGKTWESTAIVAHTNSYPTFIVTPRIGKLTWEHECHHLVKGKKVVILGSLPPSERHKEHELAKEADIVVAGYSSILSEFADTLKSIDFKSAIIDESHYIKHEDSQRSQIIEDVVKATRPEIILPMSGSHWENRAFEIWTTIRLLGYENLFGGELAFKKRYCWNPAKRDYSGSSNLEELNEVLRTHFMIRRQKKPGKTKWRQAYVPISDLNLKKYRDEERVVAMKIISKSRSAVDAMIQKDPNLEKDRKDLVEEHIRNQWANYIESTSDGIHWAKSRELIGRAKVESAIEWINNFLAQEDKLVVFAHHKEVQKDLYEYFAKSGIETVKIDSSMKDVARKEAEKAFLEGTPRLIICSVGAASENINLASSSNVFFAEGGLKPMTQARLRIDRKPQKSSYLNAWYLRAVGTIDDWLYELCEDKLDDFEKGSGDRQENKIEKLDTEDFATAIMSRYYEE